MAKFKVGDKVRVREDLVANSYYGNHVFIEGMNEYKGEILTIKFANNECYILKEVDYRWTDEMLEEVKEYEIEKTVLEIINEGHTGKKYIHECGTIVYVDNKNTLRFDYTKSNLKPGDGAIERCIVLDMKLKGYRKEYTFQEAFKAYEEGREIESCEECRFKLIDKDNILIINYAEGETECSSSAAVFSVEEIRGRWYIND